MRYNKINSIFKYVPLFEFNRYIYRNGFYMYSTSSSNNYNINISNRLKEIMKELKISPTFIFENLDLEYTQKLVLNETRNLSGIYIIINKKTKDYYIGSAATNRFNSRFRNHLINLRGSKIVKSAVNKYKLENFAFLILELYPNVVTKENNKDLLDLENKYLKLLLPSYNILTEAGSSFGYKHTEIVRERMKNIYSEARREQIGNLNRGKKLSPEIIEKMRKIALKRPPMPEDIRQKCITHTRPVTLYYLDGSVCGKYLTIRDAAKAMGCNEKTIGRALKRDNKLVKRQ